MFCIECGKKISLGAEFCGFCGTPITPEQQEIRDSNQNSNQDESGYPSDWSTGFGWTPPINPEQQEIVEKEFEFEEPRIERSRSSQPSTNEIKATKKDNKKGFYIFILILTPIVFFVKGGGIYGLTYTMTQSLILLAITSIPIKILRLVLFIIFGFFFLVGGLTPP